MPVTRDFRETILKGLSMTINFVKGCLRKL